MSTAGAGTIPIEALRAKRIQRANQQSQALATLNLATGALLVLDELIAEAEAAQEKPVEKPQVALAVSAPTNGSTEGK